MFFLIFCVVFLFQQREELITAPFSVLSERAFENKEEEEEEEERVVSEIVFIMFSVGT